MNPAASWRTGLNREPRSAISAKFIQDRLPSEIRRILHLAGKLGRDLGLPVYAVGGFVRDLLLNKDNQDIDLVVEGNGMALAKALARELNGRVREHQKFLTSVVIYHDAKGAECRIDVATAALNITSIPPPCPRWNFLPSKWIFSGAILRSMPLPCAWTARLSASWWIFSADSEI